MLEVITNWFATQPSALWVSIIALIFSFHSILSNYKNTKNLTAIRTLEKRTFLLYEIISAKMKMSSVKNIIRRIEEIDKSVREDKLITGNPNAQNVLLALDKVDNSMSALKNQSDKISIHLEEYQKECERLNEKSNIADIEKLLPTTRAILNGAEENLESMSNLHKTALETQNLFKKAN